MQLVLVTSSIFLKIDEVYNYNKFKSKDLEDNLFWYLWQTIVVRLSCLVIFFASYLSCRGVGYQRK